MAIYHFSAQVISRGRGQSAVAAAAYRSGDRLTDERTGETKCYKRDVQPDTMILAPSHAPKWVYDRECLWNTVEQTEKRKDAQLAREMNVALPVELSKDQQKELICEYVQKQFVDNGMIADLAIHRDDVNNPHAHIMLTTRDITADGFGPKNREWNNRELLNEWREQWANHTNKALECEGIQERISHLSHEARGLEVLPTVHLGHVAHSMEKRGVESDRGNMNREREAYNRVVVDLQTYREEKKALEQEIARKQEQKQQVEHFNTPEERVHLRQAAKILKTEPTLSNIAERNEQINKWEERVHKHDHYIRWKDKTIQEAANHYREIHLAEQRMQQAQQKINEISWMNPLKIKENQHTKKEAEQHIAAATKNIELYQEKVTYHQEKLAFTTEEEFKNIQSQHQIQYPKDLEINRDQRARITYERDGLHKAELALKNAVIEKVATMYPERPEMRYISYETAQKLNELSQHNNNKVIPIETIEKNLTNSKSEIQRLHNELHRIDQHRLRLQRTEGYVKKYEEYHALIENIEHNPLLKGKVLHSKLDRQKYEQIVAIRDQYYDAMQKEDISGRADFQEKIQNVKIIETQVPRIESQIQFQENRLGLLESVINGLEQASRASQREQNRQQLQKQKKKKRPGLER